MNEETTKEMKKVKAQIHELYNLNANISLRFIAMKEKVTDREISFINQEIGGIIKKLREITDRCGV